MSVTVTYDSASGPQIAMARLQGAAGPAAGSNAQTATASKVTNHLVAAITAMTVTSGAVKTNMTQNYPNTGDQNWGCVKKADAYVIVTVTTSPNTDDVWKKINWGGDGGQTVSGQDNEREYSTAASNKFTVHPTLAGQGVNPLYIWVIWATVTIDSAGTDPTNAPVFAPSNVWDNTGQKLGLVTWFDNQNFEYSAFKNCQIAQLSPVGIGKIADAGWEMKQQRWTHYFLDGKLTTPPSTTAWAVDNAQPGNMKLKPDSNDKISLLSGHNSNKHHWLRS